MFLLNSCQAYFSCGPSCEGQALFRSYGCFFAEFLGELSLVRLALLELTTCVGLRYGSYIYKFRDFSRRFSLLHSSGFRLKFTYFCEISLKIESRIFLELATKARTQILNAHNITHPVIPSLYVKVMEY